MVHGWLVDLLPRAPALVLDVGAGTGRDAAWLASRGLEVVAVEPSGPMLAEGQRLHPSPSIRWISNSLPGLDKLFRLCELPRVRFITVRPKAGRGLPRLP
ncbi:MAG: class I SAM-dependent methyltransferase [Alphaproteobacteria bacterium]|nr:class I SAM-dependent methyltransferase [Alphaproteobacteria bacterium]